MPLSPSASTTSPSITLPLSFFLLLCPSICESLVVASSQMVMGAHQNKLIQGGHRYYELLPHLLSLLVSSQQLSLTSLLGGGCERAGGMDGWLDGGEQKERVGGGNYRGNRAEVREKVGGQ